MGQYWIVLNLDRWEFIRPRHGKKLWEIAGSPGIREALVVLLAPLDRVRGGGDLNPQTSESTAKVVGRWAGDRIVMVGDYSEDADLPTVPSFGNLYDIAMGYSEVPQSLAHLGRPRDITELVYDALRDLDILREEG